MKLKALLVVLLLVALGASNASAVSFELTPFAGTRFGGEFDDLETPLFDDVEIDDSGSFGIVFGVNFGENFQLEIIASRQTSDLIVDPAVGSKFDAFELDVDHFHIGGAYVFGDDLSTWRPFAAVSLGGTRFDPDADADSDTKFSFSLGGGVKYYINDYIGLRGQARWTSTRINDSDEIYCDPFFCYEFEDANYLNQTELSLGLIIRFGE